MVYLDVMPGGNVTFHVSTANYTTKHIHYYVEALPGQTATRTYNGKGFVEYKSIDANYNWFTEAEDYVELVGFTKGGNTYPPEAYNNNNQKLNSVWNNSSAINVYCYYTRDKEEIRFVSVSDGRQEIDKSVYYQQSLKDYKNTTPTNGADGYAFVGWYTDESCAEGTEFDFNSTMPNHDITLYAKWETQRCRVVLEPNAPEGEYSFANNQGLTFRLDYNETVDDSNINSTAAHRPGYVLDHWYAVETGQEWRFDTPVNSAVPGVNPNYQQTSDWINNVYGDHDGQHDNVVNILKLKAYWKLNLTDNSVYVIYKVGDAYCIYTASGDLQTIIPVDDTAYILNEGVEDVSFTVADAPEDFNDSYNFKDWALLNPDGSKSGTVFVPTTYNTVSSDYFVTETITDDSGATATIRYIFLEAEFTPQVDKATAVIFKGNGGKTSGVGGYSVGDEEIAESYLVNKTFNILSNDTFVRDGYTFVEWNTASDGSGETLIAGTLVAADNLTGTGWDSAEQQNIVYAIWQANTFTVHFDKNGGSGQQMADQVFTYDVPQNLRANTYTYENYDFVGWNTEIDGSGTMYTDQQEVKNLTTVPNDIVTLYAQWHAKPITITSGTQSWTYDGNGHTNHMYTVMYGEGEGAWTVLATDNGDGTFSATLPTGDVVTITPDATATVTNVTDSGEKNNTFTYTIVDAGDTAVADNKYDVESVYGDLSITAKNVIVTITGDTKTEKYIGTPKNAIGYTVSIPEGSGYPVSAIEFTPAEGATLVDGVIAATRTHVVVGEDTDGQTDMGLAAGQFSNSSSNFNVTFSVTDGYIKIQPREVTLTSGTDSKKYDGTKLTKHEVTVGGADGLIPGDTFNYTYTGEQLNVGSSDNTFTYTLQSPVSNLTDYVFTVNNGTLTITDENVTPSLVVTKADQKEDGYKYKLGETVTWDIRVTNIYSVEKTIVLTEVDGVTLADAQFENVPAGESRTSSARTCRSPASPM